MTTKLSSKTRQKEHNKQAPGRVKTVLRVVAKIVVVIFGLLAALLVISGIVNVVASSIEARDLRGSYGKLVHIDGGNVNVDIQGNGKQVVVLLPGLGVSAPALEFKPLIDGLKKDYTVVTYEGFGYGLSDDTTKPRTAENIASEIHQTLSKLGYSKYSIVAHSVSGIYTLKYAITYPDEVQVIIGIDSSVPQQNDFMPEELKKQMPDVGLLVNLIRIGGFFGIVRDYITLDPGSTTAFDKVGYSYSEKEKDLINKLTIRNFASTAVLDENIRSDGPISGLSPDSKYPQNIPIKFFLAKDSVDMFPRWIELHKNQPYQPSDDSITVLPGAHFLYHTHAKTITDGVRQLVPIE